MRAAGSDLHSISSVIAAQLPHAVGAAYAIKYRKETGRAVLVTFGDGCTSEGEWHESLNFAAVHELPIVFLCENNEWAISTPLSRQMGQPDVYKRAAGYGMPGVCVDGMDAVACYGAAKAALDRARTGGGPTLVEAKCYRFLSHTTDDDDRTYRSREEVAERRKGDPVPRFERSARRARHSNRAVAQRARSARSWRTRTKRPTGPRRCRTRRRPIFTSACTPIRYQPWR